MIGIFHSGGTLIEHNGRECRKELKLGFDKSGAHACVPSGHCDSLPTREDPTKHRYTDPFRLSSIFSSNLILHSPPPPLRVPLLSTDLESTPCAPTIAMPPNVEYKIVQSADPYSCQVDEGI